MWQTEECRGKKKRCLSSPPPWEFQTPISASRAPDPSLLGDPGLLINLPGNWLSQWEARNSTGWAGNSGANVVPRGSWRQSEWAHLTRTAFSRALKRVVAWTEKLLSWLSVSHYAKASRNPTSSTAPFRDAAHWIPDLHHQLTVLEFRRTFEGSLPKFTLASGTDLHFGGLVSCTHCVLSRGRQHALSVHRMLEQEEGLAPAAHSFHRCEHSSYQRLWKTCLVSDLGNTNVICVCAVLVVHGLGPVFPMRPISASLPCHGKPPAPPSSGTHPRTPRLLLSSSMKVAE